MSENQTVPQKNLRTSVLEKRIKISVPLICFGFWPLAFGKQPPVFSSFFASALALFRKHQRLPVVSQNVFLLFSEAKRFLIISSSQMAKKTIPKNLCTSVPLC